MKVLLVRGRIRSGRSPESKIQVACYSCTDPKAPKVLLTFYLAKQILAANANNKNKSDVHAKIMVPAENFAILCPNNWMQKPDHETISIILSYAMQTAELRVIFLISLVVFSLFCMMKLIVKWYLYWYWSSSLYIRCPNSRACTQSHTLMATGL